MELTARQRRALDAICDTFLPRYDGLPSATELGVPQAIADALDANPRESERKQTAQLLGLWDTAALTAIGRGGLHRFSSLPLERREAVLRSWCDSRVGQRRAAFTALRKAALLFGYMVPGPDGGPNPRWEACAYPGPIGPAADAPAKALQPLGVDEDTALECDVVVCGSGAGGGTAAGVLAAAGLDVVVLEAGDYYDDADFDGAELGGFQRLYLNAGGSATHDQSVGLLAGECLGGGTVVNYTTSFRTPDDIREEWAEAGAEWLRTAEYTRSLDAVCQRLSVNQNHNRVSHREQVMERGLRALGWHSEAMPRNVIACEQGRVCGYCGYGCSLGAKQSCVKTWLADAQAHGAKFVVNTRAERIRVQRGAATGVEARTKTGHRVVVKCKNVVV